MICLVSILLANIRICRRAGWAAASRRRRRRRRRPEDVRNVEHTRFMDVDFFLSLNLVLSCHVTTHLRRTASTIGGAPTASSMQPPPSSLSAASTTSAAATPTANANGAFQTPIKPKVRLTQLFPPAFSLHFYDVFS
jgi:hypothetical protein